MLDTTPKGEGELAECLAVVQRICHGDEESWYREWVRSAEMMRMAALAVADAGALEAGRRKWLRAIEYYDVAASPIGTCVMRRQAIAAGIRACASDYLGLAVSQGEVVTISWRDDYPLEAYFLPASDRDGPVPTVICVCEPGQRKERSLLRLAGHAAERGLSLLVVDLLGPGPDSRFDEIVGHHDLESAIGSVMDYACDRDDVDDHRIAILADDWCSSFVARGIACDPRYAAAVCDAGLWDIHERVCLSHRLTPDERAGLPGASDCRVARQIMCPLLVALPKAGWLRADIASRLVAQMKREHLDVTLEVVASHQGCAADNAQANAAVFDWIAARLASSPQLRS
ncbi:alpha/beta hydrolase family protein [Bradyrhizobium oligotrophicum]|uniref:alpha/beta hydrolase family protein n=1 Tax=Bradyrhizobium oligotrophicum TaxID=44255 RepID=UPI003EBE4C70